MATLSLEGLRKEFDRGRTVAVSGLDLEIADGEFVTVVGPSGCGKTTTLRMVAGLEAPTEGTILLDGVDITEQSARERDVAMVFQNYALYPHKTVEQNMAFGLRMSTDLGESERAEKVRRTAEMMGIEDLLEDKPDELSGGQKQRVALGRAIVREPAVFLFDEPLSNLDAKLRTSMRAEIQRLQNDLGITAVYVTHDQEEAMTMGDRIVVLNDGELQQVGTPREVYEHPANRFVAGFIGSPSMNFLEVEFTGDALAAVDGEFSFPLSDAYVDRLPLDPGARVELGIRPEHVATASSGAVATVEVVEPVGSDNYLYLDVSGSPSGPGESVRDGAESTGEASATGEDVDGEVAAGAGGTGDDFIARVDADVTPEPDDEVVVDFDESKLRLFDLDTGEAIVTSAPVADAPEAKS